MSIRRRPYGTATETRESSAIDEHGFAVREHDQEAVSLAHVNRRQSELSYGRVPMVGISVRRERPIAQRFRRCLRHTASAISVMTNATATATRSRRPPLRLETRKACDGGLARMHQRSRERRQRLRAHHKTGESKTDSAVQ